MALLIVERGRDAGQRIPLRNFPVRIGRDPSNDIVLKDREASRFHLRLKQRGQLVIAEDLESRNGTYINGDRILNAVVKNGDKILVGSTEFSFVASKPGIHLASEVMNFDMVVAEELGIRGPIDLASRAVSAKFKPIRIPSTHTINLNVNQDKLIRRIFEIQGNIAIIHELEEAAKSLLKHIPELLPGSGRAAFFVWSELNRQLIPVAARQFKKKKPFILSQRAFDDVITRKKGLILPAEAPHITQSGRHRLILPMIQHDRIICMLHVEADVMDHDPFPISQIEILQTVLTRTAPSFESMLLRHELDSWLVGMMETMIATVEAKDTYTRGHSERVSKYCLAIADELRLDRETKKLLMVSALCHDIGKIGVPDNILKKATMLSAEEYEEMKLHPQIGAEMIRHMPNAKRFISGVLYHHEKWDGTGYPEGLAGEEIPFFGRIVGLADVYDAMVSGRAYSGFMDQHDAAQRLLEESELFDPEILKAFIRAHESGALTIKTDTQNQEIDAVQQAQNSSVVVEQETNVQKKLPTKRRSKKS